ncbi:tail fiber domain-containing protein [Klebsiella pneumoniae]|uniref:tail fiber domain-containing protein n=1 Tax=Klebsiella pneumoniae TaxID=573 RepID=UPI0018CB1503|nr:tail fiber domain-containing protein [Klebsiella pneumoniae]MBG9431628.1 tail fiber domain-containing protein [Klebsiella pneumoniae]MDF7712966.1 tail fiber domain-containing protein [Klebsiella pneumoniae]HBS3630187.1 tail fiber domain-containing protein [Klebsiella pneumoniae]HBX4900741.1 tail fiber domain-containing protein [Klebsiella pneumoniae]HBX4906549.1 tail fiber domain-containing protein [Klebsiella pneumoniae]
MANISDQLAADIHNAFNKYYTDLTNQDQIFFGVGDVKITKQDGTTATVRSWNKVIGSVDTAAQRGAENTFTAVQTFSAGMKVNGNVNCMADNAMIYLGKNSDLALLKKSGQGGTIAVGSGTPFKIQRTNTATVSPASTVVDILTIGTDKKTTVAGALAAGGDIDNAASGKMYSQAIELSFSTPYIDFHFNYSTDDFTGRIMATAADQISVQGSHWRVDRDLRVGGMADIKGWTQCGVDLSSNRTDFGSPPDGSLVSGGRIRSRMLGRGGNVDPSGAWGGFYIEEYVGTEHRIIMYMDGFGRTDAWSFRAGGTISTPKGDVMTTGSDVRLKTDFTQAPVNASERIDRLGVCEYRMKGETRVRRGFIAQQVETVDKIYTYQDVEQEIDGERIKVMNIDYVAIIADLVASVQELTKQVRDLNKLVQT